MGFEQRLMKRIFEESQDTAHVKSLEAVASHLREKYQYDDLDSFVTYLESMEKFFIDAEKHHENSRQLKEDLIHTEIYMMSTALNIDQQVLQDIYSEFQSLATSLQDVHVVTAQLMKKYTDKGCQEFIEYLRQIVIIFLAHQEERVLTSAEIRDVVSKATDAKMKILSADGKPDEEMLKKIKEEFFAELQK